MYDHNNNFETSELTISVIQELFFQNPPWLNDIVSVTGKITFRTMFKIEVKVKKSKYINLYNGSESYYVYRRSFFCSAVLTPQHYHWYAATRFAFPGG